MEIYGDDEARSKTQEWKKVTKLANDLLRPRRCGFRTDLLNLVQFLFLTGIWNRLWEEL